MPFLVGPGFGEGILRGLQGRHVAWRCLQPCKRPANQFRLHKCIKPSLKSSPWIFFARACMSCVNALMLEVHCSYSAHGQMKDLLNSAIAVYTHLYM